jgi:bla regulator protein blaR1
VLLLPEGIADHLEPAELHAILAHELCHVRRCDNLAAVMHMVVEAAFWFHPLVWWLGARLMEERERACDEEVLGAGSKPEAYTEGILKICELYLQSPLKCVAGVTGANLKQRIEAILNNRLTLKLNFAKRAGLAAAGILAVAIPVILGVTNTPTLRAQAESEKFEVATIKPTDPRGVHIVGIKIFPGGRFVDTTVPLKSLIATAFDLSYWQVTGGDAWVEKDTYDIEAKPPDNLQPPIANLRYTWTQIDDPRLRMMLQALLIDRFNLSVHRETKTGTVYLLERSAKPLALHPTGPDEEHTNRAGDTGFSGNLGYVGGRWGVYNTTMPQFAQFASAYYLHAPVLDRTNLMGSFDYKEPGGDVPDADYTHTTDSFLQLIPELGLKLERTTGLVETLVIDHAEKPSPN